ncbi:cytochrome P450 [Gracilibacillus salinarum]|uniref:Cytochrome P450 n=1 Tax=Gracilibacillus salinarum TaxID=2932255 RepID=A0ABY4GIR6_9BACI|nr:cytochrome P450 [Gracilibacillus salinarum]UOQ84251.1 cytochrome P450 [Gracilibacillus salinarum]
MANNVTQLDKITNFQTRSEEFFPIEWYTQKLEESPIFYDEATDTWNVFKHKDVTEVLTNYEYFSSEGARTTIQVGSKSEEGEVPDKTNLNFADPPKHRKRRSLLQAAFTPRSLKNWEPRIQEIIEELVEELKEKEQVDLVQDFAGPIPSIVITDLFGIPITDRDQFKEWVDTLFKPIRSENAEQIEQEKQQAAMEYYQYLFPIIVEKRQNLSDDIISDLIRAEVDGERFTDDEIVRTTMLLLGAGVETTAHLLANTFYSLLYDDPSLYQELREDPSLAPKVTEEMLRYRFHSSKRDRTVKKDNQLLGVDLKEGDLVVAWMSAANLDEEVFEDPLHLNIHRPSNKKHITFGKGPHFCMGAPLARLESNLTLTAFVKAFSKIEAVPFKLEDNLVESATGQSLTHLPAKLYR